MSTIASASALLACTLFGGVVGGIAIRHDLTEARYLEFGATFPSVVQVAGLGSGTLIASDWVLTAAHVPEMLQRMRKDQPLEVSIAGETYKVARVVYPEQRSAQPDRHDIALLQLAKAVPDELEPLSIWSGELEIGTQFVIAGWGILAQGDQGIEVSPKAMAAPTRALRAGWNTLDRRDDDQNLLFADFDAPDDALRLEAGPCIGDSGGPAMIRIDGEGDAPPSWHVAGVIALIDDADKDRIIGEYGDEFGVTAVRTYAAWIRKVIAHD